MEKIKFKIQIEPDNDGYISFECPFCKSAFGLNANEYQEWMINNNELYCPCCGLRDAKDNFYTEEVIKQIQQIASNYVCEQINREFNKMSKSLNNKYVKIKYKPLKTTLVDNIKTKEDDKKIFICNYCKTHMKVDYIIGKSRVFCSYCGRDIC